MELNDVEFQKIRVYIKDNYGINLGDEKKTLVYSRLRSVVSEKGFSSFDAYFDYLMKSKNQDDNIAFINKITTNHTFFMRESDHFDYFKNSILPYIEEKYNNTKDLRLWCAACSSGEEPYTLQMYIQEYFKDKSGWNTEILATDISSNVLSKAVNGVYTKESINVMPKDFQTKYFKEYDKENYIVTDQIKKSIVFRKINLMDKKFVFKKPIQVIFCRNVMIYFDNVTREELTNKFYDVLDNGGYLFIGHSESLNQLETKFEYIAPSVYRKST